MLAFHLINWWKYAALAVGISIVLRARIKPLRLWSVIVATAAILLINLCTMFRFHSFGYDFQIFRRAGLDVWAGTDPYAPDRFADHPFLNPPTALPLFALFAELPLRTGLALWTGLNMLGYMALAFLVPKALSVQKNLGSHSSERDAEPMKLPLVALAGLVLCVTYSDDSLMGLYVGQLNLFVVVVLLAALIAQGRGRPVWAGFWLSLATAKIGTMLPFLLLFLRKADRWTWVSLAVFVLILCSVSGPVTELPLRVARWASHIEELALPGKANDYSFEGPRNECIIGFEPLFYRLGMRDRLVIRSAQYLATIILGAWIAYLVIFVRMRRPAVCILVFFYSALFLYHRDYDMVILALPLYYSAYQAQARLERSRWLHIAISLSVMGILYMNAPLLRDITAWTLTAEGWGRLVQATVLPYATWLLVIAMVLLYLDEMRSEPNPGLTA